MKPTNPLTGETLTVHNIEHCLDQLCSQESANGEPYDQMQFASEVIKGLKADVDWLKMELAVIHDNASPRESDEIGDEFDRLRVCRDVVEFVLGTCLIDRYETIFDNADWHPMDKDNEFRKLYYDKEIFDTKT